MRTLSIECSSPVGSLIISQNDQVLASKTWSFRPGHQITAAQPGFVGATQHSELLLPAIESCLKDAHINLDQIELFATSHGPGRFTGIRVAINCVKALCFSLGKPALVFNSLHVLAQQTAPLKTPVIALVNAQKNLVFFQKFENSNGVLNPTTGPLCTEVSQIESHIKEPTLCLGDGYELYKDLFSPSLKSLLLRRKDLDDYPAATSLSQLVNINEKSMQLLDWKSINPLYLRASEAEEKLKAGGLQEVATPNLKN
ncbi:MAG: tRNA (adenosine(37)-N6)-threonylcarbamoyltransferase complex dimerization subunit type 1 TsaB [Bdellovibrionales bacterium]